MAQTNLKRSAKHWAQAFMSMTELADPTYLNLVKCWVQTYTDLAKRSAQTYMSLTRLLDPTSFEFLPRSCLRGFFYLHFDFFI
jgi:hypothetical protein